MKKLSFLSLTISSLLLCGCYVDVPEDEKDRGTSIGVVEKVYAHGTDLVVKLNGDNSSYYLNRYLLQKASINTFRLLLQDKKIIIKHFAHGTKSRPIDTLFIGSEKLF